MEEFEEMTPGTFQALCKRRNVRIKYERYAHAITASAVYNTNRGSVDDPVIHAFDFIRDDDSVAQRAKLQEAKKYIKQVIGNMPMTTTRATYLEKRAAMINDLKTAGHDSAEQLFDECWPTLKPTDAEKGI